MWLRNGILSDKQFMKHFGKDIFIYPFNKNNLKGSSYNLTASRVAYYEEDKKLISILVKKDKIMIPPKKIVYIQTEESIYTTQRICGTYHTKVKWVSRGLSPISTTLDPCYFGTSLITVVNLSEKEIEMDVGESFCTLIFHKMSSGHKDLHDNVPFRKDISSGKIYDFSNAYDIIMLKKKHELEEEQDSKNKTLSEKEKELKKELRKQELELKELEYKNFLEEWYEKDYRRNKDSLVNTVKRDVRKENEEKLDLKISIFLITFYILVFLGILFIEKISPKILDKCIDLKSSEKLMILSVLVPGITFVHQIFVKLIIRIRYLIDSFMYRILC